MEEPGSPGLSSYGLSASRQNNNIGSGPSDPALRGVTRRVTFNSEPAVHSHAPRRTSIVSTVGGAERRGSSYKVPPYLTATSAPNRSRPYGLDQLDGPLSPVSEFLDDASSVESENEETDLEYDSDTAISITSEEKNVEEVDPVSVAPDAGFTSRPPGKSFDILKSRFLSYGDEGEDTTIELTHGQSDGTVNTYGAFRWVHLQDEVMDFERFIETSLQALNVSPQERRMMRSKLEGVKKQQEKPFFAQYAAQGRYMVPFVYQELWLESAPSRSHLNRKIVISCFPFFLLDKHRKRAPPQTPTSHPPLTLLQTSMSSTEPERDMRQVVCRSLVGQKDSCFYVSQLWFLLLDDGHIFTYGRLPEGMLGGDLVSIIKEPTWGAPHVPFIKVTDGGNCIWHLAVDDCRTWFDFTANFMGISSSMSDIARRFDDLFRVTMHGRDVTSAHWANVIKKAQQNIVHLVLIRRKKFERPVIVQSYSFDDTASLAESESQFPWEKDETPPPPGENEEEFDDWLQTRLPDPASPRTATWDFGSRTNSRSGALETGATRTPGKLKEPQSDDASSESASVDEKHTKFHALSWFTFPRRSSTESPRAVNNAKADSQDELSDLLAAVHHKLLRNSNEHEKKAYVNCHGKTLPDVTKYLLSVTRSADKGYEQGLSALDTFFVATVQVFELFLPLDNDSAVAKRYWGSVYFIMRNVLMDPAIAPTRTITGSMDAFKRVAHLASIMQKELSKPHGPDLSSIELPSEFRKAWLHCILHLTLFRYKNRSTRDRERHLEKCEALLDRARQVLWRASAKVPLHRKEVAPPLALISVIVNNLIKDISRQGPRVDIASIYREYWKELEFNIREGHLKNAQPDIVALQQEVDAIIYTLEDQQQTLKRLYDSIEDQSIGWSSLNSRHLDHAPRPELPLILECIEYVRHRDKAFRDIGFESSKLSSWINEQLASTKRRHDKAIYAFTIVTVVFLPLSFVTSFLGMNTTGIRDMESGQWVFWASALPLTFVVVLLALLWTDELGHAWKAMQRLVGLREKYLGFAPNRDRKSYWQTVKEEDGDWKDLFRRKTTPNVTPPTVVVTRPPPIARNSTLDPWDKPYRRTQTYRSVME